MDFKKRAKEYLVVTTTLFGFHITLLGIWFTVVAGWDWNTLYGWILASIPLAFWLNYATSKYLGFIKKVFKV